MWFKYRQPIPPRQALRIPLSGTRFQRPVVFPKRKRPQVILHRKTRKNKGGKPRHSPGQTSTCRAKKSHFASPTQNPTHNKGIECLDLVSDKAARDDLGDSWPYAMGIKPPPIERSRPSIPFKRKFSVVLCTGHALNSCVSVVSHLPLQLACLGVALLFCKLRRWTDWSVQRD